VVSQGLAGTIDKGFAATGRREGGKGTSGAVCREWWGSGRSGDLIGQISHGKMAAMVSLVSGQLAFGTKRFGGSFEADPKSVRGDV